MSQKRNRTWRDITLLLVVWLSSLLASLIFWVGMITIVLWMWSLL